MDGQGGHRRSIGDRCGRGPVRWAEHQGRWTMSDSRCRGGMTNGDLGGGRESGRPAAGRGLRARPMGRAAPCRSRRWPCSRCSASRAGPGAAGRRPGRSAGGPGPGGAGHRIGPAAERRISLLRELRRDRDAERPDRWSSTRSARSRRSGASRRRPGAPRTGGDRVPDDLHRAAGAGEPARRGDRRGPPLRQLPRRRGRQGRCREMAILLQGLKLWYHPRAGALAGADLPDAEPVDPPAGIRHGPGSDLLPSADRHLPPAAGAGRRHLADLAGGGAGPAGPVMPDAATSSSRAPWSRSTRRPRGRS